MNIPTSLKNSVTFVAIDFETANAKRNSACELGIIICRDSEIIESIHIKIKPPTSEFSFQNTQIHGISWNDVKDEANFLHIWPRIQPLLSKASFIAAHNASFDKSVLKSCCTHYGLPMPDTPWVCTYRHIATKIWPKPNIVPNHKLNTLCHYLGIQLSHHEALSDARAVAEMVFIAKEKGWQPDI